MSPDEKIITIKVESSTGIQHEIIITAKVEQWLDNEDVALEFLDIIRKHSYLLIFKSIENK